MGRLADWTVEQYNSDRTHVRSSELKDIAGKRGPREYYFKHVEPTLPEELLSAMYPHGRPEPPVKAPSVDLLLGTLFHDWVLRGIVGWYVSDARVNSDAGRRATRANLGKIRLTSKDADKLHGWREAIDQSPEATDILQGGMSEQTFLWTDDTGLDCKARMDLWQFATGKKVDIKTTRHATREGFDRQATDLKYYLSAAHYTAGEASVEGFDDAWLRNDFSHLVLCKEYPYAAYVFPVAREWMDIGRRQCREALDHLANCRSKHAALMRQIESLAVEELPSRGAEIKRAMLSCWPDWIAQDQEYPVSPSQWDVEALAFKAINTTEVVTLV